MLFASLGHASSVLPRDGLFQGANLNPLAIEAIVDRVQPGGVLIVSEEHGNPIHYARQKQALRALERTGRCEVSVGLEFLSWIHQDAISDYFEGSLAEADFLTAIGWSGIPFAEYRDQALFPRVNGGNLIGINAPRSLTGAISKRGLLGLTPEEESQMPPQFELGSALYRERFDLIMGGHVPAAALDRYFAAQSVWDESMAWRASEFLKAYPTHCLVIIVGDFHASWGGGLPNSLKARGVQSVTTISQIDSGAQAEAELREQLEVHPRYGVRADGIWISQTPP